VYVAEVHDTHRGPQIVVSRAHRLMLRRLFEQEVPEIYDGRVEIKAIAREAGARSKVAVLARQQGIDPVGSCVGMRGVRIQNIVNELNGEKIDVIEWHEDAARYVANALSPAQVVRVSVDEDTKTATVVVPERQLSLAIGKEGQNARLAAKLTGWRIDIKSEAAMRAAAERAREESESEATPTPALAEAGAQVPGEVLAEG
jgi:N utilization substance protein A